MYSSLASPTSSSHFNLLSLALRSVLSISLIQSLFLRSIQGPKHLKIAMMTQMRMQTSVWQMRSQMPSTIGFDMSQENSPMIHFITKQFNQKPQLSRWLQTSGNICWNQWSRRVMYRWQKSTLSWMQWHLKSRQRSSQQLVFSLKHCSRLAHMGMMPWKYLILKDRVVMMRSNLTWWSAMSSVFWFQKYPLVLSRSSLCSYSSSTADSFSWVSCRISGASKFIVKFQLFSLLSVLIATSLRRLRLHWRTVCRSSKVRNSMRVPAKLASAKQWRQWRTWARWLGVAFLVKGEGEVLKAGMSLQVLSLRVRARWVESSRCRCSSQLSEPISYFSLISESMAMSLSLGRNN